MSLEILWFVLIAVLWAGYFVLEGFDFGVGMLLPFLPRNEGERRVMFDSIGPFWDGNEVWLVGAAGATFAAVPAWSATGCSGCVLGLLRRAPARARAADRARRLVRVAREGRGSALARGLARDERDRELRRAADLGDRARELRPRRAAERGQRLRRRLLGSLQRL